MNKTYVKRSDGGFADIDDITAKCKKVRYDGKAGWPGASGINVISDGHEGYVYETEASTMVVGATGSGKTRRVLLPYVYSCIKSGASLVLNDPKGEIYTHMYDILCKEGYKVLVLDYRNPLRGERFNPLEYPAKLYKGWGQGRAMELFSSIGDTLFAGYKGARDPYWQITGKQYFVGLAELLSECFDAKLCTINNIYNVHIHGDTKYAGTTKMAKFFSNEYIKQKHCWKLLCPTVMAPNETRGGLTSVFTSAMSSMVLNENLIDQTSDSTFKLSDLVDRKTALFFITRDEGSAYDGLISVIVDEIYEYLIDVAEEQFGGRLNRRVEFILDEFGNLPALYSVDRKLTAGRSRNIRWLVVIQSLKQLNSIYGKDIADIIMGNGAGNIVYLYSPDITLLQHISSLCGNVSGTYGLATHSLLPVEKLRSFDKTKGECLMLLERCAPFVSYLPDISEYPIELSDKRKIKYRGTHDIKTVDMDDVIDAGSRLVKSMCSNMMNLAGEPKARIDEFCSDGMAIDKMIAEIDAKIAELEAEEAAEKAREAEEAKKAAEKAREAEEAKKAKEEKKSDNTKMVKKSNESGKKKTVGNGKGKAASKNKIEEEDDTQDET